MLSQFRHELRRALQRWFGIHVYRRPPRGADLVADIANDLPLLSITCIVDVGANLGQSADVYRRAFPDAAIHCVEPVAATADQLEARLGHRVSVHRVALSSSDGEGDMALEGGSETFRLIEATAATDALATERVTVQTLDRFCRQHGIDHISLLKIDTEGADLEVLKGARGLLQAQRIDLIQVEAGLSPLHDWHVPFETLKAFLEAEGYHLFSVFEQTRNWHPGAPYLQWANPVFISTSVVDRHRDLYRQRSQPA